jgi:hypothetical protein
VVTVATHSRHAERRHHNAERTVSPRLDGEEPMTGMQHRHRAPDDTPQP